MSDKIKISEHDYQVQVIDWCNLMGKRKWPMLKWIYAVPNGGDRHKAVAAKLKAEGVKPGVPDLCLPFPKPLKIALFRKGEAKIIEGFKTCGLYIEMKSKDTRGRVSPDQKAWLEYLAGVGYKVEVAWNAKEAIQIIEAYLGKPSTTARPCN